MTKNELNDAYFNWMYQLVFDGRYSKRLSYQKLLRELHRIEFTYSIPMDGNRAEDGVDLRYRVGYENGYSSSMISASASGGSAGLLGGPATRTGYSLLIAPPLSFSTPGAWQQTPPSCWAEISRRFPGSTRGCP